ncbi:ABC transporter ATP-binding protein [Deminuibacter soli]|uniref:ABC transporter ATP-binding protein n=1 Tax=Deminuibacter soli TaxID=2291815 RepID=A0A3E1NKN0_9BACT|nr:ABC transporter ATP-binding protein [Deminuibacter soli]RFM28348.1 ABC transporter ATP-binding protein [Deminuibacter soli]
MNFLAVSGISNIHEQDGNFVIHNISFTLQQFVQLGIAGETGCGKSTLLKMIAGFAQPSAGTITFLGQKVIGPYDQLIPGHPGIVYLSQHFELPNFLTVAQVLEYVNELPEAEAFALYEICRITHLMHRRTDQLSGGEKQRIALARLLVTAPKLLMMDEPFSNLDTIHKNILKSVVRDIAERLKITCILVSHDPMDNLAWANHIIVMQKGEIVQQGTPEHIYHQPLNEYVAGLFGKYNLLTPEQAPLFANIPTLAFNGKPLFVRPEQFTITTSANKSVKGTVTRASFLGSAYELEVQLAPHCTVTVKTTKTNYKAGKTVYLSVPGRKVWELK